MDQPMLSITQSKNNNTTNKVTANLLPCRIHRDGSVGSAASYWTPSTESNGNRIAHFRGRELHGKALKVPKGYRGVVVEKGDAPKSEPQRSLNEPEVVNLEAGEEEEEDDEMTLGALETQAEFDEMVIWGHESMADAVTDPYARGVEEWVQLSSQIHSYDNGKAQ